MSSERSITILVVDDNNHARSFVVDALRTAGFDVIEAATGAEGLRLASHGPDLICPGRRPPRYRRPSGLSADQGRSGDCLNPGRAYLGHVPGVLGPSPRARGRRGRLPAAAGHA